MLFDTQITNYNYLSIVNVLYQISTFNSIFYVENSVNKTISKM
jgi:hypothetical protein